VFITSLVANLLDRGRMPGLAAAAEGRIPAAFLQPQPDDTVPRFDYETHLATMTGPIRSGPKARARSPNCGCRCKVRPAGLLAGVTGLRTVHIDIVDYPGEWLLDLALLEKDYATWSAEVLTRIESRAEAAEF
jgi:predicted YcjX-like family ATPase